MTYFVLHLKAQLPIAGRDAGDGGLQHIKGGEVPRSRTSKCALSSWRLTAYISSKATEPASIEAGSIMPKKKKKAKSSLKARSGIGRRKRR